MLKLPGTTIFMYHVMAMSAAEVQLGAAAQFCVLANQFESHLQAIVESGFSTITLDDFQSGASRPDRRVTLLTFDDGSASDYSIAFPRLQTASLRATFFLNTSSVGTPGFLTWAQARQMQQAGMAFESHGHEHLDFRALPPRELDHQLETAKRIMEDRLGVAVRYFAAPHGLLNPRVVERARELGYVGVCGTRGLPARPGGRVLKRVAVLQHTQLAEFRQLLFCHPGVYARRVVDYGIFRAHRLLRAKPD